MNRLFALTALLLFLGLDASHAQTSLHKQRVDEQIDETSCASANWLSRTAQLAESTQSDVREAVSNAIEICGDSARLSGNYVIAMKWWHRAADRGNASAQMKLAYFYAEGRGGTPADYTQSYKWYDIAASIVGAKIDGLAVGSRPGWWCNSAEQAASERAPEERRSERAACGGHRESSVGFGR